MGATIHSVNVNPLGGVPKPPVGAARLLSDGVEGDKQRNLKYHGGPSRAVCLFSLERIETLRGEGHPIGPGTTGENLTVEGLDWDSLEVGQEYAIGEAVIQLTDTAPPCNIISGSFSDGDSRRIDERMHAGWSRWYASVAVEGLVDVGDSMILL